MMMMRSRSVLIFLSTALIAGVAFGGIPPVIDGSIVGDPYGSPRTLQTVQTGFGGGFNELAGAYATFDGSNLYLAITGKIEGFNKAMLFIDSVPGGENTITADTDNGGDNPNNDGWANGFAGFTFDAGFEADYLIIPRAGFDGIDKFDLDFNSVGNTSTVQSDFDIFGGSQTGTAFGVGAAGIDVGYDNSLTGGSIGGTAGDPAIMPENITSGLEFKVPLASIGSPNIKDIRISAILSNGNFDFMSNQTLGGLPLGFGNLAGPYSSLNLANFDGDQFFTIPEPGSLSLVCLGLIGLLANRRR